MNIDFLIMFWTAASVAHSILGQIPPAIALAVLALIAYGVGKQLDR